MIITQEHEFEYLENLTFASVGGEGTATLPWGPPNQNEHSPL